MRSNKVKVITRDRKKSVKSDMKDRKTKTKVNTKRKTNLKGKSTSRNGLKSKKRHQRQAKNKKNVKSSKQKGGRACEYIKVEGMTLPGLEIPEQSGVIEENCTQAISDQSNNLVLDGHPNALSSST